jgi:hypothetical protein
MPAQLVFVTFYSKIRTLQSLLETGISMSVRSRKPSTDMAAAEERVCSEHC